ncbi:MAG: hypothetical protein ACODAC_09385 [Pseudomonadota bacterium]
MTDDARQSRPRESRARDSRARADLLRRALGSLALLLAVTLSWTYALDRAGTERTQATFTRALAAFAVARGLNGVISVAQGTELAVQPVGVGVTLTVGEVLDPLNDLVERFSWLALLACVSLGTQMLLAEITANAWMNGLLSVAAAACVAALWFPGAALARRVLLRAVTLLVVFRFLFPLVTLATGWVDETVLAHRQAAAIEKIELTRERIEELREETAPEAAAAGADSDGSVLGRLGAFLDDQRGTFDVKAGLDALAERVESTISEIVKLIIVFTVQTILVPVAALLLAYWAFGALWRASWRR